MNRVNRFLRGFSRDIVPGSALLSVMTRSKKNPAWTLEYSSDGMFRSVWMHDLYLRIHTPNLIEFAYKNQASIPEGYW